MKNIPYKCGCCNDETFNARGVEVTNMNNPTLCTSCHLTLVTSGELIYGKDIYDKDIMLMVNKKENPQEDDTTNVTAYTYKKMDWFERQRFIDEQNQMSGFPSSNGVHASY